MHSSYFQVAVETACNPAAVLQWYLANEYQKKSTSWISISFSIWTESAHKSCGQWAQIHFTTKPICAHRALVAGRFQDLYRSHHRGLRWRVKWPWLTTVTPDMDVTLFSWRGVCAIKCLHIYFLLFVWVCCHVIMPQEITAGKRNLHHLGRDAEGSRVCSWRKSFPPRTCPLQVQLENASLAALLAKRQQQSWASVYLFSHFHQEFN